MRKFRLVPLILATLSGMALFFAPSLRAQTMPMQHGMMSQGQQCQASCVMHAPVGVRGPNQNLKDKETEPLPTEPHYLSLVAFSSLAAAIAIILKLYHVHWRPPDRLAQLGLLRI